MKKKMIRKSGQTMTEYIIIVAVVALAAIAVFAIFGDTIKRKMSGAVSELDSTGLDSQAQGEAAKSSKDYIKKLDADGASN
jgi:Flp pilus assembly pilin Flp